MKTHTPPTVSLQGLQNPFRVARLRADLSAVIKAQHVSRHDWQPSSRQLASLFGDASKGLQGMEHAIRAELDAERGKPVAVRAYSQASKGQDDAWKVWAILSREVSETLIAQAAQADAESGFDASQDHCQSWQRDVSALETVCAELWAQWGFDASASPLSDYSPTGHMFQRSLSVRVSSGHIVLSQSGARDV